MKPMGHYVERMSLDYEIQMIRNLLHTVEDHRSELRDADRRGRVFGRIHRLKRHLRDLEEQRARLGE